MTKRPAKSFPDAPYRFSERHLRRVVELFDSYGRPLLLTSREAAVHRGLYRRAVLVCVKNICRQVYLQRRPNNAPLYAGLWDVSAVGTVFADECPEDAARREVEKLLGARRTRLRSIGSLPYTDSRGASISAMFFLAGPCTVFPIPKGENDADGMFVDASELEGLVLHHRPMFTPELIWAVQSGWIFPALARSQWGNSEEGSA